MSPVVLSRGGGVCLCAAVAATVSGSLLSQGVCRVGVSASLQSQARQPGWHPARLAPSQLNKMILLPQVLGRVGQSGLRELAACVNFWARQPVRLVVVGVVVCLCRMSE